MHVFQISDPLHAMDVISMWGAACANLRQPDSAVSWPDVVDSEGVTSWPARADRLIAE